VGLNNSAGNKYEQPFLKNLTAVINCPGPNIAYFSKSVSLQEMIDDIYGRTDIITDKTGLTCLSMNYLFISLI
jgi:hypothetical protein